jgi:periplasmic mercuric ion binding protein
MKSTYKFSIILVLGVFFACMANAQEIQQIDTTGIKVSGVCGSCKARIENAALIKGVKWAQWDIDTHILTVIYRKDKVNSDDIQKSIAAAGHDTEKFRAPDEAYNKLPRCCAYRDNISKH